MCVSDGQGDGRLRRLLRRTSRFAIWATCTCRQQAKLHAKQQARQHRSMLGRGSWVCACGGACRGACRGAASVVAHVVAHMVAHVVARVVAQCRLRGSSMRGNRRGSSAACWVVAPCGAQYGPMFLGPNLGPCVGQRWCPYICVNVYIYIYIHILCPKTLLHQ
jgi:hypothetical protein